MKLPQQLSLDMTTNRWASLIEPFLNNPANNSLILKQISLTAGPNTINHKLGRKLSGWKTTRVRSAVTLYDDQDSNQAPQLTLILVASAPCVVDLEVF